MIKSNLNKAVIVALLLAGHTSNALNFDQGGSELDSRDISLGVSWTAPMTCTISPTHIQFDDIKALSWTSISKQGTVEVTCNNIPQGTDIFLDLDGASFISDLGGPGITINKPIFSSSYRFNLGVETGYQSSRIGSFNVSSQEATKTITFDVDFILQTQSSQEIRKALVASGNPNLDLSFILPVVITAKTR